MDMDDISVVVTDLSVDSLRASGCIPHWFGLGFIQLKLNDSQRLHFWHPDLAQDVPEEELHDHRYEFESKILVGELTHQVFEFKQSEDGDHEMVHVSCEPGKEADPKPISRGVLVEAGTYVMRAGSSYTFPPTGFHRTIASSAVTLLTRGPKVAEFARVVRKIGEPTVCPFARKIEEDALWEIIGDLLGEKKNAGYHLRSIEKGVLGEASKVREEIEEFIDAEKQGVSIMSLVELSDAVGAMSAFLERHHPSISIHDLCEMSRVTRRAFANGHR
jgi:hypothetical protein